MLDKPGQWGPFPAEWGKPAGPMPSRERSNWIDENWAADADYDTADLRAAPAATTRAAAPMSGEQAWRETVSPTTRNLDGREALEIMAARDGRLAAAIALHDGQRR